MIISNNNYQKKKKKKHKSEKVQRKVVWVNLWEGHFALVILTDISNARIERKSVWQKSAQLSNAYKIFKFLLSLVVGGLLNHSRKNKASFPKNYIYSINITTPSWRVLTTCPWYIANIVMTWCHDTCASNAFIVTFWCFFVEIDFPGSTLQGKRVD